MSSFDDGTSKCKGVSAEHQAGLGVCRATQHFDDGTSKCKICGVLAENDAFDGGHQQKFFTPLQAHGMENISAWRGRIFSLWMPFTDPIPHKSK